MIKKGIEIMNYNFHTHTYRCSHASGTEEEYIKRAIENGIEYMGFSDHIPFVSPSGIESGYRVPVSEAEDYCKDIAALREKYKDKIKLYIGFEAEYYADYFESMLENARKWGAEYLILGQHFFVPEGSGNRHVSAPNDSAEDLEKYADSVVEAIKTGAFTYVAHPDVFNFIGDKKVYQDIMRRICIASREYNIPLELNFLGLREGRSYPCDAFLEIAGEEQSPVTFGFDAHEVKHAYDGDTVKPALALVKKYNLNYIGKPEIVSIV